MKIQIPKPLYEQEFEDNNEVLWRCILNDPMASKYGRRGQRQHGVDIVGCRNRDPAHQVGIQCKLKSDGHKLSEKEVRAEVNKALEFEPPLTEYVIVTTAPDDANLQSVANEISIEVSQSRPLDLSIHIFGWDKLQREIQRHPEAHKAFDPSHAPQIDQIESAIGDIPERVSDMLSLQIEVVRQEVASLRSSEIAIVDSAVVQSEHEQRINDYVELIPSEPETALGLLQKLEERLASNASNHIRFRIKTNIAACQLELGQEQEAANGLIAAWDFAAEDPKAIANKALGFLLLGNRDYVRSFAEEELKKQPSNARLAACYILSLVHDESIEDPISLIPEETRSTPEVAEAHVQWLMEQGELCSWWDVAISAYHKFPEIEALQELGANALLSRAMGGERYMCGQPLGNVDDVNEAISIYESLWESVQERSVYRSKDLSSVPVNLMTAYHIVGDSEAAVSLGLQAHGRFPDEETIKVHLASLLIDQGDTARASEIISGLADNTEGVTTARFKIAIANEDWPKILEFADENLDQFPEPEKSVVQAKGVVARMELAESADVRDVLEKGCRDFVGNTRALTMLAQSARTRGVEDISQLLFESATLAFQNGDDTYIARLTLAEEAFARGLLDVTIETLLGQVALDRDSGELRTLATALAFDFPVRERATRFFSDLAPDLRCNAFFQKLEGILHFNKGDFGKAITPLLSAFEEEPEIYTLLCVVRAYFAIDDQDAIRQLVSGLEVENLTGSSLDRIDLSHVLLDFSKPMRALDVAYGALIEDLSNAELVAKFMGLVLRATSSEQELGISDTVSIGMWVRLTSAEGSDYEALIGESQDRPWGQAETDSNSFILKCLGLRIGDKFEKTNSLGVKETWSVAELKPWWLQAFHHLTANFGQRFPEAHGFASLNIADDDIEPVLEQVRRYSAMARQQADLYLQHDVPLVVAAGDRPGGAIAFAQYLVSIGEEVKVCFGVHDERDKALRVIQKHERAGAVLDAFTAWHAAVLKVLPVLKERLGPLAIPVYELNRLKEMTDDHAGMGEGDTMRLDFRDGQFFRHVETTEDRNKRISAVQSLIKSIEEYCSVEPVQLPDNLSELGEKLIHVPPDGAFSAGVMACETRILVSEDLAIRQYSQEAFSTKGVWIQVVLFSADQAGTMSTGSYAEAAVYLARHRHGYVSVSATVLLAVFERDESRDLNQLEVLCTYVGGENADPQSNTRIVADFINTIWANAQPIIWADNIPIDAKILKATNLMFRTLIHTRRNGEWVRWAASLYRVLATKPRRYLLRWCEENMLPVGQLRNSLTA